MAVYNVHAPTPCEVVFLNFMKDSTDTSFGPTPSSGMTISGLFARALSASLTSTYTVEVFSVDSSNVQAVYLSCQLTGSSAGTATCSDARSFSVPGDVYLQVRVKASDKGAVDTKWRAIFLY